MCGVWRYVDKRRSLFKPAKKISSLTQNPTCAATRELRICAHPGSHLTKMIDWRGRLTIPILVFITLYITMPSPFLFWGVKIIEHHQGRIYMFFHSLRNRRNVFFLGFFSLSLGLGGPCGRRWGRQWFICLLYCLSLCSSLGYATSRTSWSVGSRSATPAEEMLSTTNWGRKWC